MIDLKPKLSLYLVTDEKACLGRDLFWVVEQAIQGGVTMVQLREKNLGTHAFMERAKRMKGMLEKYSVPLIINDRVNIALEMGADGVHVGQSDMSFSALKDLFPKDKIIGISAESQRDVIEAYDWEISYLAASPLFSTPTKTDVATPWELEGLRWMRQNSRHPLVVIGGLNSSNVLEAVRNGADGIAVISAICSAQSPRKAAEEILKSINEGKSITK